MLNRNPLSPCGSRICIHVDKGVKVIAVFGEFQHVSLIYDLKQQSDNPFTRVVERDFDGSAIAITSAHGKDGGSLLGNARGSGNPRSSRPDFVVMVEQ